MITFHERNYPSCIAYKIPYLKHKRNTLNQSFNDFRRIIRHCKATGNYKRAFNLSWTWMIIKLIPIFTAEFFKSF